MRAWWQVGRQGWRQGSSCRQACRGGALGGGTLFLILHLLTTRPPPCLPLCARLVARHRGRLRRRGGAGRNRFCFWAGGAAHCGGRNQVQVRAGAEGGREGGPAGAMREHPHVCRLRRALCGSALRGERQGEAAQSSARSLLAALFGPTLPALRLPARPRPPRSKLPTHHPEDRNSLSARNGAESGGAAAMAAASCAAEGGEVIDPKAQDLQFLFLAMTEEVGAGGAARGKAGRQARMAVQAVQHGRLCTPGMCAHTRLPARCPPPPHSRRCASSL